MNAGLSSILAVVQDEAFWRPHHNQTTLHPLAGVITLALAIWLMVAPRKMALAPILILICFIPTAQRVVIAGLDFTLLRLVTIAGFLRVVSYGELAPLRWRTLDTLIVSWATARLLAGFVLRGFAPLILGETFDYLGSYFLCRALLRDLGDLRFLSRSIVLISVPVAIFFWIEKTTAHNVFSVFGGVPEITLVREGRLRCQGAYTHPILAGCFWAGLLPMVAARYWDRSLSRTFTSIGVFCSLSIIVASSSSTPVVGVLAGMFAGGMFLVRRHLSLFRMGFVLMLVLLHFARKRPVWHLLARANIVGGSTGWHRYHLVDAAIRNFDEWAFFGTLSTAHWGMGLVDVTNQYVVEGTKGGILTLVLFLVMIWVAFKQCGLAWRSFGRNRAGVAVAWAAGAALFVHTINFIGCNYNGQILFIWFLALAVAGGLGEAAVKRMRIARRRASRRAPAPGRAPVGPRRGARGPSPVGA